MSIIQKIITKPFFYGNIGFDKKEGDFMTKIIHIPQVEGFEKEIQQMAQAILDDETVILPTETVYGLGAHGLHSKAIKKIYEAKGRPQDNPLILHISHRSMLEQCIDGGVSEVARKCMDAFWPGPLTLIFKKHAQVPQEITAGLPTVAVRMPNHPVALRIIEEANVPVAAPSANRSGKPSPTQSQHVIDDMNGRVDYIVTSNDSEVGLESTVLDLSGKTPIILRPGGVTKEQLEDLLGMEVWQSDLILDTQTPRAPGMKYTHYAPEAPMFLVMGSVEHMINYINKQVLIHHSQHKKVAVIGYDEYQSLIHGDFVVSLGSLQNQVEVAHNVFDALRQCDQKQVDIIYAIGLDDKQLGSAIMNRLRKAAGHQSIEV